MLRYIIVVATILSGCSTEQSETYESPLVSTHHLIPVDTLTFYSSDSVFVTRVAQISSWHNHILISDFYRASVMVFDTMLQYKQTLGRKGKGPGEFQNFPAIVTSTDTLYLFDRGLMRVTRYDQGLSLISTSILPEGFYFRNQALSLSDKFVLAMNPARMLTKAQDLDGEKALMVLDTGLRLTGRFWRWDNAYFDEDLATATYSIQNADVLLASGWGGGFFGLQKAAHRVTYFGRDLSEQRVFGRQPQHWKPPPRLTYEQTAYGPEMISYYAGSTTRFLSIACDTMSRFVLVNYVNLDSTVFFQRTMLAGQHFLQAYDEGYNCVFDDRIPGSLAFVRGGKMYIQTHEQPEFIKLRVYSLEKKAL